MKKLQHTPGPWTLKRNGWQGQYIFGEDERVDKEERFIAEVSLFYDGAEANARLIAAAPEMLEALIEFCEVNCTECNIVCGTHCALYDSKTVIERATGLTIEEILSE